MACSTHGLGAGPGLLLRRVALRQSVAKPLGCCGSGSCCGQCVTCHAWVRGGLQMTTYVAVFMAAWAGGYVLGYQIRAILRARYAS